MLPVLYALGTFTFVRLVESSVEDLTYGRAINRIRSHYLSLAGDDARLFMMGAHDDTLGVLANMGITRPSRWQLLFTLAAMVAVLTAVVGGAVVAFVAGVLGAPLGAAAGIGGVAALASLAAALRWQRGMHDASREDAEVLFPSGAAAPAHPPVARAAAAAGAEVVVASRRPVDEGGLGTGIAGAVVDVTDEASVRALFEEHGPVDHLVVTASPGGRGGVLDQDVAAARRWTARSWAGGRARATRHRRWRPAARSPSCGLPRRRRPRGPAPPHGGDVAGPPHRNDRRHRPRRAVPDDQVPT